MRDDLQLMEAARDGNARGGFLVFDPVRHQYFRIGRQAARVLSGWGAGTAGRLIEQAGKLGVQVTLDDVAGLLRFVTGNQLTELPQGGSHELKELRKRRQRSVLSRAVHGYLFFKIPLLRPQKFLDACLPFVRWMGTRAFLVLMICIAAAGIYLAGRQWDVFLRSFADFSSFQGMILLGLALVILKSGHELGHAFVASSYGARVPVMGVAFMVMFPMLYSDVTDSWRLTRVRQRLMVDAAGMMVELSMGAIALLVWSFTDGPVRQLCFFMATAGWAMSLAINLSPFMRFDGYHILADLLGVHNLQQRGFSIGRWKLREWLFGLGDPPPERFDKRLQGILVFYAFGTWIYRLVLFTGIALLVYHMFFKVLGIVLFSIEMVWFVFLPIWQEAERWWRMRDKIRMSKRAWVTAGLALSGMAMLFVPLDRHVNVPAVLAMAEAQRVFAPRPAQVERVLVKQGQTVARGDVLVRLYSDDLAQQIRLERAKLALIKVRLARGMADNADLALRAVLERERATLVEAINGLEARVRDLVVTARQPGRVSFVARGLAAGRWVNPETLLVHVVASRGAIEVRGLVEGSEITRLKAGATGVFIPENPQMKAFPVELVNTGFSGGLTGQQARETVFLSSLNGGPVAYVQAENGKPRPVTSLYRVLYRVTGHGHGGVASEMRGTVVTRARPVSLAGRFARRVVAVLLRESGV